MADYRYATVHRMLHKRFLNGWLQCVGAVNRFATGLIVSTTVLLLGACGGPQSALNPAGESAQLIAWLWWGMFWYFSFVLVVVIALWIYALLRKNEQTNPQQALRIHRRWVIGGGLILPIASVTAVLVVGIPVGQRLLVLGPDDQEPLRIEVIGHRWWWEVRYPDTGVVTANQIYLPVNTPVDVYVSSADVIHSFWIPRIAGKMDMIPGRVNRMRLLATETGPTRGQCAEFCGLGHAHMILAVEVLEPEAFTDWLQARQIPAQAGGEHTEAVAAFRESCGDCHRVAGITEGGKGPDLSDIGSRELLDMRVFNNNSPSISEWLNRPNTSQWSEDSPDHATLAPNRLDDIAAWLETLGQ